MAQKLLKYIILLGLVLLALPVSGYAETKESGKPEELGRVRISEITLGPGDTIDISVYRHDDLKKTVKIDMSGTFMFPLIGDVSVNDKSIFRLRDEIQEKLAKYIINPQVTINLTSIQSQKIIILGEVNSPGIFNLDTELTVLEAITKAGGMTPDAKLGNVVVMRKLNGVTTARSIDLNKVRQGDISQDMMLHGGDIVYLPAVKIADISWFFGHLSKILSPIVNLESGIVLWPQAKKVLQGRETTTTPLSIPAK